MRNSVLFDIVVLNSGDIGKCSLSVYAWPFRVNISGSRGSSVGTRPLAIQSLMRLTRSTAVESEACGFLAASVISSVSWSFSGFGEMIVVILSNNVKIDELVKFN